jgi:DNA-binding MarR family transcriptional regulator
VAGYDVSSAPGHLIRRAQQRHQTLWVRRVGDGLTSMQFAVLTLLDQRPDVDQRTLGAELSIDSSTLAEVCRRLDERGLLERARSAGDSRRYELRVTGAGRALLADVTPKVQALGDDLLEGLSAREGALLLELLRRVVDD